MIREKNRNTKPIIDLTGPQGNAFVLMGLAQKWGKELGIDTKPIIEDMMSDDYEHLLETMEKHFGQYAIFER